MNRLSVVLTNVLLLLSAWPALASCPPEGYSKSALTELRESGFAIDAQERNALAVTLLDCLADPDPTIRDGVVYEGLTTWLRKEQLDESTISTVFQRLQADLLGKADEQGFLKPFAALVMSEVARSDRIGNTFSPQRREALVQAATRYLSEVSDYRGFSETEGWRHGVAHGADLVLQLVLNENIDAAQVERLVEATLTQVAPPGATFYIYGEPGRLARAVYYAHRRGVIAEERWRSWLQELADPAPLENWGESYSSQAGLARRHDTLAFLMALHVYASASGSDSENSFAATIMEAIGKIW